MWHFCLWQYVRTWMTVLCETEHCVVQCQCIKLHSFCINIWLLSEMSGIFFFLSNVPFFFLFNNSLDLHVSTMAVTIGKCSRITSVNLIKSGRGRRWKKTCTMKINKILPFFVHKLFNKNHTKESTLLGRNSFKFLFI